jgi:hypothetical protein
MAYNLLKGKRGIITGALDQNSIAWKVAEQAHAEGATFVLTNAPIAMRMGEINVLAEKTNSKIVPADATNVEELTNLFTQSQEIWHECQYQKKYSLPIFELRLLCKRCRCFCYVLAQNVKRSIQYGCFE